jgi:hypothetical protein
MKYLFNIVSDDHIYQPVLMELTIKDAKGSSKVRRQERLYRPERTAFQGLS